MWIVHCADWNSSNLPSRWTWARGRITSSEGACRQSHHFTPNPNLSSTGHGGTRVAQEESSRECQRRPPNSEPGGPHPNFHLPTSENLDHLPSMHVWSCLVGISRPSPSPQGQLARGMSWRPLFCLWPNMAAYPRRTERGKAPRLACWNARQGARPGAISQSARCRYFLS